MNRTSTFAFIFLTIFLIALTSVSAETYIGSLPAGTDIIINQPSYVNLYAAIVGTDAASSVIDVAAGTNLVGFSAGDTILIIQTQGGITGVYEMQEIASIAGNRIRTTTPLLNRYITGTQVVRIPVFGNITINSLVTAPAWNGATGGIVGFRAWDKTTVSTNGVVSAAALGGRGGSGSGTCSGLCKKRNVGSAAAGESFNGLAVGGTGSSCVNLEGQGGSNVCPANLRDISLGAAGGGGQCISAGGKGGGIILIQSNDINVKGHITADGAAGQAGTWSVGNAYGAGGGAGGSVILSAKEMTLGAGSVHTLGGNGGFDGFNRVFAGAGTAGKIRLDFDTLNGDTTPPGFRNRLPVANADNDITVNANTTVLLDGSASFDPDGRIVLFTWNFGDGTTVSTASSVVTHSFPFGTFEVTLTVTDNNGATARDTITVIADGRPTAVPGGPYNGTINRPVTFDGSASTDNGRIVSFRWNFGDGTTASGAITNHTYQTNRTFGVTLTVTDNDGNVNSASTTATISETAPPPPPPPPHPKNLPPVANAGNDLTVNANTDVLINGSGSFDPDGIIVNYTWDFGDGNVTSTSDTIIKHKFPLGIFIVKLTVTDNDNETASDFAIIVADGRPTAVPGGPYSGTVNRAILFDGSASTDNGLIVNFRWDFGDGNSTTSASPTIRHTYTQEGNFRVTLTVTDNNGNTNSATTTATVTRESIVPQRKSDEITILRVDMFDDVVRAGEDLETSITVENDGDISFDDVHITVSILDLGVQAHSSFFDLRKGDRIKRNMLLSIPEDAPGEYDIRIVVSNDEFKRVTHRTLLVE